MESTDLPLPKPTPVHRQVSPRLPCIRSNIIQSDRRHRKIITESGLHTEEVRGNGVQGIQDRIELVLTAVRNYGFNTDCIKDGIINTAVIVGTNACGKTNLGLAIFDIVSVLTDRNVVKEMRDRNAFLNGDSDLGYASFEYEFQFASGTVRYEYRKDAPDSIVYERLTLNGKDVFIRDGNASDYSGLRNLDAGDLRMDVPDGSLAVLRYVANNTVQCPDSPMSLVMGFAERMHFFGSLLDDPGVMQDDGSESPEDYIVRNGLVNDFQSFLNDMAGMDVELATEDDTLVQMTAKGPIPFRSVSSGGTRSLMLLYCRMRQSADAVLIYMDGFDASYHYGLSENVLRRMVSETSIQTILTTHNTSLLRNRILRPDCCLRMDNGRIRSFADLTGHELRQGHNLEKLYRGGEFGG